MALQAALSAYNTGDFYRGFTNGYVARYYGPGGVPALIGGAHETAAAKRRATATLQSIHGGTTVFAGEATHARIE